MKDEKYITNEIKTSDNFDVVNMGISDDPEDQKMILNILTNTLYTDKIAAVLREYGCNAADANVEAGKPNVPIKVHIPTPQDPYFSVRDVGGGMTEEQILKVFCRLGRSTKRNSNAFTGMLGIGSKAGFDYGNSFLVTSFNKGTRTVYNCFRDSVGLPQMAKMDASPTTEEDGIEIKLSVRAPDVAAFQVKAVETYQYFAVPPIGVEREERRVICQGKNWKLLERTPSIAVMGNVGYDLAMEYILPIINSGSYGMGVELAFEIGELEIAANREGLQYKDQTQKAIRRRVKDVVNEIPVEITKTISTASSLWEARLAYKTIRSMLPRLVSKAVSWKGQDLSLNFDLSGTDGVSVVQWMKRAYNKTLGRQYPARISATSSLFLKDKCSYSTRRIREFLLTQKPTGGIVDIYDRYDTANAIILDIKNDAAKKKFWKDNQLDGAVLTPISKLPLPTIIKSSTPRVYNNKYTAQVFTFTPPAKGIYASKDSDWWTINPANLKTGKGIYIELFNFTFSGVGLGGMREQLQVLKELGIFIGPLYGVKEKSVPSLGPRWVSLQNYLAKKIYELTQDKNYAQDIANHKLLAEHNSMFRGDPTKPVLPGPAKDYWDALKSAENKKSKLFDMIVRQQFHPWISGLPEKLPLPSINIEKLQQEVLKAYPMFKAIGKYSIQNIPMDVIVNYVNLVEQSKK